VAGVAATLEKYGAMEYTAIVSSTASDSSAIQYITPYAGCAMAEEFLYGEHRDVLIVYDDLSKHAVAYRAMSLLLRRPPGREAYPGDVFYLHSRLLERAACLSAEQGGGSITAIPVIETVAGDITSYIPTNVISITDGQIHLQSELFFAGQRPAIDVGLSVSRVGGKAQTKAMKKVAGSLRIELAQYRELAIFTQFGSELDQITRDKLLQGERLVEVLKQPQYSPLALEDQVILLFAAAGHHLTDVPVKEVRAFNDGLLKHVKVVHPEIPAAIAERGELADATAEALKEAIVEYKRELAEKSGAAPSGAAER
jgi:F-type H+-transporting ATPase subunit alpha